MDLGGVWRVPIYWPGGVRHRGGVTLVCGFRRERGKASADIGPRGEFGGGERECSGRQKP